MERNGVPLISLLTKNAYKMPKGMTLLRKEERKIVRDESVLRYCQVVTWGGPIGPCVCFICFDK